VCVCIFITKYYKARRLLDGFSSSPRREKEINLLVKEDINWRHILEKEKGEKRSFFDLPHDTT
jgi:hypothetical protein